MTFAPASAPHRHGPLRSGRSADRRLAAAIAITFGVGWFLQESGLWRLGWNAVWSSVLIVLGIGLVATARTGRRKWPVVLGVVIAASLLSTASIGSAFPGARGGVGEETVVVAAGHRPRMRYDHKAGAFTLDLRRTSEVRHQRDVRVELGAGRLLVLVRAQDVELIAAHVNAGNIALFSESGPKGIGVEDTWQNPRTAESGPRYHLSLRVGAGRVVVAETRADVGRR